MKTVLNLSLQLADLVVPVGLSPTRSDGSESFRKLHGACANRITFKPYCEPEQTLVDADELVSAWEVAKGEYLVLGKDELAALEPPESRTLEITGFVERSQTIDRLVERRYYLAPSSSRVAVRPYALLARALDELDVDAIARFVAWGSERICAITPIDTGAALGLELRTLAFLEDAIGTDELDAELAGVQVADQELELALDLVYRMTRKLRPEDLESRQRPLIRALLDAKLAGEPLVRPADAPSIAEAPPLTADLTGALKSSLKKAPRRRRPATAAR
jgi:DNA end-binding protein Ku